ncbi:Dipeptidyl aminopeptidase-like protein 6 DPPX [Collichthys lucidus]|uniref:Dipeptidyl aminopeptidase-like protein 6 DPPX n=1 Tax=Collichthys lucidus TaxID=240159 RepID=A0A4U5VK14_COLLU|nr:Dipeptidyl aminopeptidase-like protein 6 DPPX [Collichthys lucidus]TKS87495.1 Dipeptidyl aminopeptidase-like protein 6 DPPX [Collichthys lucidus]
MSSIYQRFSGTINTNNSFPNPPEASHLLGQGVEGVERAIESQRPRFQHQYSRRCEDEDVKDGLDSPGAVRGAETLTALLLPLSMVLKTPLTQHQQLS